MAMRCVFFDRDGIVNESPGPGRYVTRREDFRILPEFIAALRVVCRKGYAAIIVTNQRAVAKGLIRREALEDLHARLRKVVEAEGLALLDIIYCPHEKGVCECRKPQPGMLLQMARKHGLDLAASWMIGDAETDVQAGRSAGCRTILVNSAPASVSADRQIASMRELPELLENVLSIPCA